MNKLVCTLMAALLLVTSMADAAHPLIGTWMMTEKIGSKWFTDYITITAVVNSTGAITAKDEYGWPVKGYVKGNAVILIDVHENYYMDGYFFDYVTRKNSKHMGVTSWLYDFESNWHVLKASKLTVSDFSPQYPSREAEGLAKRDAASH